jgi:class 3 adenylate cyclase
MPPSIAQAVLQGTPDSELATSLESVAVAFITLDDFAAVTARLPPKSLISWLNSVYQALDGLLDLYGGVITKVETVSTTD